MRLRRTWILVASCAGLTGMSLPAGPACEPLVVFMTLAKNTRDIEQRPRHTAGGSIWIANR
jgi:hypothetical protein